MIMLAYVLLGLGIGIALGYVFGAQTNRWRIAALEASLREATAAYERHHRAESLDTKQLNEHLVAEDDQ